MNEINVFESAFENATVMKLEKNATLAFAKNCEESDYHKIKSLILNTSDNACEEEKPGGNLYTTFVKDNALFTLSYTPFEKTLRLIKDETDIAPVWEKEYTKITNPLITQVRNPYFVCDCGMTYIIRLWDGRFVIIDGGEGEYDEIDHTMDILRAQNVLEGKSVIAMWFITHAHGDHFDGFVQIMDKYGKDIVVQRLAYNWSVPSMTGPCSVLTEFNRVVSSLENTQIITPRSGHTYLLGGVCFEILYACEDLYPEFIRTLNDTSTVFRMTVNGRSVMWLGDNMAQAAEYITQKYPADFLKCEMLQVGHHGYWGGSQRLHEMMDPEVLLWPCPDFWYQEIKDWDCNRFFKESENIKLKFIGGQKEVTLDMTEKPCYNNPYEKNGGVIFEKDFTDTGIYHLGMSHITGGSTGYAPSKAEILEDGVRLTSNKALSVLELLQPGFVEGEKKIKLKLKGRSENSCGRFGLVFNNAHPTVWNEIKALWLDSVIGTELNCTLELDYEKGSGALYVGESLVKKLSFVKQERPCGIYLVMQNTSVVLNKLTVTR